MEKKHLVITIVGPDKRGLVADITERVADYHGGIEESRMSRLGGEFAIIMLVSLDESQKDACLTALEKFREQGMEIFSRETTFERTQKFAGFVPYEISVWGADHEGIIHSVTEYLADEYVQLEDIETEVTKAPITGTPLFSMVAEVQAQPTLTIHQLRDKMDDLSDELGVDISVKLLMD